MNVHHLELFYYVAISGGITAATKRIPYGIQQPSVSAQISRLEKELGTPLFVRRPFQLTAEGELLLRRIQPFFSRLSDLPGEIRGTSSPHLKLAACASILRHHLPDLMLVFKLNQPEVRITLKEIHEDDVTAQLSEEAVDLSLGAVRGPMPPTLHVDELLQVPLALIAPEDFPCSSWKQILSRHRGRDGTIDLPLVAPSDYSVIARSFHEGLSAQGLSWQTEMEVTSSETIIQYVERGFGIGVISVVPGGQVPAGLKKIELSGFIPLRIAAVYRHNPKPVVLSFLQELKRFAFRIPA